jgi:hypothetical protein
MRMRSVMALVAGGVLVVPGCGERAGDGAAGEQPTKEPAADAPAETPGASLLFLGTPGGVTVFDTETAKVTFDAPGGMPSQQGNAVVRSLARNGGTEVSAFDPRTGDVKWSEQLATSAELRMASHDGSAAVLGPNRPIDGALPTRSNTTLTVVRDDGESRAYDLEGNFEPETFSYDAQKLFLIEYLPAMNPTSYTLRLLDLESGALEEVFDAHGGEREPMRGTARTQVYSPDGKRLYTYYQIFGEPYVETSTGIHASHSTPEPFYAFVHVLDLEEGWAHCVELMQPFGTGAPVEPALTVSRDGSRVYVADQALGRVAEIDTAKLAVTREAELPPSTEYMEGAATMADDSLWVAFGDRVSSLNMDTLGVSTTFTATGSITAMRADPSGERLYVALLDRLESYDLATGRRIEEVLQGGPFATTDPNEGVISGPRDTIRCAC